MFSGITQDPEESMIHITVKDNGIGMSPRAVAKAFEPFNNVERGMP